MELELTSTFRHATMLNVTASCALSSGHVARACAIYSVPGNGGTLPKTTHFGITLASMRLFQSDTHTGVLQQSNPLTNRASERVRQAQLTTCTVRCVVKRDRTTKRPVFAHIVPIEELVGPHHQGNPDEHVRVIPQN